MSLLWLCQVWQHFTPSGEGGGGTGFGHVCLVDAMKMVRYMWLLDTMIGIVVVVVLGNSVL